MNNISYNSHNPAQAMTQLEHSLNAYFTKDAGTLRPVNLLKESSALHSLLPLAIEQIKAQNDYKALPGETSSALKTALEDGLKRPSRHIDETLVNGADFNVLMASFRNLLAHLPDSTTQNAR
jgi:hypothetical protein